MSAPVLPNEPQLLASCGAASPAQVDAAVKAAAAAFKSWSKLADSERAGWLRKLADELGSRKAHVAAIEALNTGKPYREAEGDVDDACAAFRYCAALAENGKGVAHIQPDQSALPDPNFAGSHIIYEPVGVVAGILPFNFPLSEWCTVLCCVVRSIDRYGFLCLLNFHIDTRLAFTSPGRCSDGRVEGGPLTGRRMHNRPQALRVHALLHPGAGCRGGGHRAAPGEPI